MIRQFKKKNPYFTVIETLPATKKDGERWVIRFNTDLKDKPRRKIKYVNRGPGKLRTNLPLHKLRIDDVVWELVFNTPRPKGLLYYDGESIDSWKCKVLNARSDLAKELLKKREEMKAKKAGKSEHKKEIAKVTKITKGKKKTKLTSMKRKAA